MSISKLPTWAIVAILVGVGATLGATVQGWRLGIENAALALEFSKYRNTAVKNALEAANKLRDAERDFSKKLSEKDDATTKSISAIAAERDNALRELRNRPARRADAIPNDTEAVGKCSGASGAELSREDAEFLTGEAARCDTYAIRLNDQIERYTAVYEFLESLNTPPVMP